MKLSKCSDLMIFQGKVSYWTLFRPKYSCALTGENAKSTAIGTRAIVQRIRSRLMKTPRTCPQQKCRSELQSGEPPGSALAPGARDVPYTCIPEVRRGRRGHVFRRERARV